MREIKLGLIGIGKFGSNYLKTKVDGVTITDTCSSSRDYRELIKSDLDGLIIATPTNLHYEMVEAAIAAHKSFIVEKPLTGNGSKSRKLLEIYNKNPILALINFVYLFDPCFQALKKNLSKIGQLHQIEFYGLQSPTRTDGTTVIQDWGPHPLYVMQYLAGSPTQISAKRTKSDNVELNLSFESGISGKALIGWTNSTRERKIIVIGETGKIVYDATQSPDLKLILKRDKNVQPLAYESAAALTNLLSHFAACIRGDQSPITTLAMGTQIDETISNLSLLSGNE